MVFELNKSYNSIRIFLHASWQLLSVDMQIKLKLDVLRDTQSCKEYARKRKLAIVASIAIKSVLTYMDKSAVEINKR